MKQRDKEGNGVKKGFGALVLAFLLLCGAASSAQEEMRVYVARGVMSRQEAQRLVEWLGETLPQGTWTAVLGEDGKSLRELVMADQAPQLAICAPGEALPWAKEGLLLALDDEEGEEEEGIAQEVLDACTADGALFMRPLWAEHRQIAVNARMLSRRGYGSLLGELEHPVWYPMELNQMLEDFALDGTPGLEIWLEGEDDGAALEALLQGIGGGALLGEDGRYNEDGAALEALSWLQIMASQGQIGVAESREAALERFAAGETAFFIDWTPQEEARSAARLERAGVELEARPYPSANGMPMHAFEVVGAAAFRTERGAQALLACAALRQMAQGAPVWLIPEERGIWRDGAQWLPPLSASDTGMTLRRLLQKAIREVNAAEADARWAERGIAAAMRALR